MAKLGSGVAQSASKESPIAVFLENKKWNLAKWNKEKWADDIHTLDKFIILSVWFNVTGQVWDSNIQKYTNRYYSNEIRQFDETIYAIDMTFNPTTKRLVAKWNWKTDVKPYMPQWVWIKTNITILDLNDWLIKWFFVSASDYFESLQEIISSNPADTIYSYSIDRLFTKGNKDASWNEILMTEKELDKLPRSELISIQNRYKSNLKVVWKATDEQVNTAEEKMDLVLSYYEHKKEYYAKEYGEVIKEETNYAKPNSIEKQEIELEKEIEERKVKWAQEIQWIKKEDKKPLVEAVEEISIEDIPF